MDFRGEHKHDITRGAVVFIGYDSVKRVVNYISDEALEDFFGAVEGGEDIVEAFRKHQSAIQQLAVIAVAARQINETGGANITSEWLRAQGHHEI